MKKISSLILLCSLAVSIAAQSGEFRLWASTGMKVRVHKKLSLNASYFLAHSFTQQSLKYDQIKAYASYAPNKRYYITAAYVRGMTHSNNPTVSHRALAEVSYRFKGSPFRQYLTTEKFFPHLKKYGWRLSYALRWKKTLLRKPFAIAPYTAIRAYYFQGGQIIEQYDESDKVIGEFAPNGFHRVRWTTGIHCRPSRYVHFKLYGLLQKEFNLSKQHQLNTTRPQSSKTRNKFSNYWVLGLSAQVRLKTY